MRKWILPVAGALVAVLFTAAPSASAGSPPVYTVHKVGNYGGEPSIGTDATGALWSTFLSTHNTFRSTDNGLTWLPTTVPDASTGDDCLGFDQSGAVYWCNLAGSQSTLPLQADVWKTVDHGTTWKYGNNPINVAGNNACGTSCQPFAVDRQWVDGYIPPGGTTDNAEVVLMYHDFGTISQIWVNISNDGGRTFGPSTNVLANFSPSAAQGALVAEADSTCNTIPAAAKIAKTGPHKGRIYLAWIAADPTSAVSGCNASQAQAYHNLIVAWSDDNGATWTPQVAFDAGTFHDSSSPFASFTLDNQGNPYFGFINNMNWDPTCAEPAGNPQTSNCEVDMYVVWSADGGTTWQGGNGGGSGTGGALIPGAAATAFKVNSDTGTHWFPAIAAGDPGMVDVAYLETPSVVPTSVNGKQIPGGCFSDGPCTATTPWSLWAGQSLNLLSNGTPNQSPTWTTSKISVAPMHTTDICNLGIACPPTIANRHLADFISETLDANGCAHINYADDNIGNAVYTADQVGGSCVKAAAVTQVPASPSPLTTPNTGTAPPLAGWPAIPAALVAGAIGVGIRRRRRGDRSEVVAVS